jgi:hypothetical protein
MSIKIHGVTPEQSRLLDIMWNKDTYSDLQRWMAGLSPTERQEVATLYELCVLAEADEYIDTLTRYTVAEHLLQPFLKK